MKMKTKVILAIGGLWLGCWALAAIFEKNEQDHAEVTDKEIDDWIRIIENGKTKNKANKYIDITFCDEEKTA